MPDRVRHDVVGSGTKWYGWERGASELLSIFWGLDTYNAPEGGVAVTIGAFDGVHVGHRALLAHLSRMAFDRGLPSVAVTFDPHPLEVVAPEKAPPLLCTVRERAERLSATGVNRVLVLEFNEALAGMEAQEFVREVLIRRVGMRAIVVGQDFRFGRGRGGDAGLLVRMANEVRFDAAVMPPVVLDRMPVSSSNIRSALMQGNVRRAALMLGGYYRVRGTVVAGQGVGRRLGFPTANILACERQLLPKDGIYAVNGRFNGTLLRGAANLGVRPTLGEGARLLEVHLIGYNGDLYGQTLEVQFLERLRDEQKFASREELIAQIRADVRQSLEVSDWLAPESEQPGVKAR